MTSYLPGKRVKKLEEELKKQKNDIYIVERDLFAAYKNLEYKVNEFNNCANQILYELELRNRKKKKTEYSVVRDIPFLPIMSSLERLFHFNLFAFGKLATLSEKFALWDFYCEAMHGIVFSNQPFYHMKCGVF